MKGCSRIMSDDNILEQKKKTPPPPPPPPTPLLPPPDPRLKEPVRGVSEREEKHAGKSGKDKPQKK
jgi:hypothetical protein